MVWNISCSCTDKIWECVQCTSLIQRAKCVYERGPYNQKEEEGGKEGMEGEREKGKEERN